MADSSVNKKHILEIHHELLNIIIAKTKTKNIQINKLLWFQDNCKNVRSCILPLILGITSIEK